MMTKRMLLQMTVMITRLRHYIKVLIIFVFFRAFFGCRAGGGGCSCRRLPRQPVPEQAELQKGPSEHLHQQRQPQSGTQL